MNQIARVKYVLYQYDTVHMYITYIYICKFVKRERFEKGRRDSPSLFLLLLCQLYVMYVIQSVSQSVNFPVYFFFLFSFLFLHQIHN